jgi:hypothetical protein
MATYKGKVVLVVNTASACGFTPQYAELQVGEERGGGGAGGGASAERAGRNSSVRGGARGRGLPRVE